MQMQQSSPYLVKLTNLLTGNDVTYSLLTGFMLILIAITFIIAIFKLYFLSKEHFYSSKFIKSFKNATNFESLYEESEELAKKSIAANAFLYGFKSFYGVFKLNQSYQSGSSIELAKKTMNLIIRKKLSDSKNYSWILYFSFLIPGIAIGSIILNYADYIDVYKTFDNINPIILANSLRLLFISMMCSLIIFSVFLVIDKYLDYRSSNLETFVDEFAYIIHKNFYAKESDSDNFRSV